MTVKARITQSHHHRDPRLDPANKPACADADPELFFPVGREHMWPEATVTAAKAFCGRCPVLAKCRLWANESRQADGIVAGLTPKERRAAKAQADQDAKAGEQRSLLAALLAERDGDTANLWREMIHPAVPIAGWAE